MEYRVHWTIDLDADTPEHAARKTLAIRRNPGSWATCFEVRDKGGRAHEINLGLPEETSTTEKKPMPIYVTVETSQGVIAEVVAYLNLESAEQAERHWLKDNHIRTDAERENKSQSGTEFVIRECPLKP